jgi:hypothetical protein
MEGPAIPAGLKPFPTINPTIQIRKESYAPDYSGLTYLDGYEDEDEEDEEDDELERENLDETE